MATRPDRFGPEANTTASNLTSFGLAEMLRCSVGLRRALRDAPTMEAAARQACRYFYDSLLADDGKRACALVRCYKTHTFGELEKNQQDFALGMLGNHRPKPDMRCLTLLATVGDEKEWNDRRQSRGHQAIPLPTEAIVERAPMISQLIRAFGIDITAVVNPTEQVVRDLRGKSYGVFHVADAKESPYIPAKDFVTRFGIKSVVGFGGSLASGDLFAMVLFTRVPTTPTGADRFRNLALDMKGVFFGYDSNEVFDRA